MLLLSNLRCWQHLQLQTSLSVFTVHSKINTELEKKRTHTMSVVAELHAKILLSNYGVQNLIKSVKHVVLLRVCCLA